MNVSPTAILVIVSSVAILAIIGFPPVKSMFGKLWPGRSGRNVELSGECAASPDRVGCAARRVLATGSLYSESKETVPGRAFHFTCRPNPWTIGTEVDVELLPAGPCTTVTIRMHPEWFVRDDIIERYRAQLHNFVMALHEELRELAPQS